MGFYLNACFDAYPAEGIILGHQWRKGKYFRLIYYQLRLN